MHYRITHDVSIGGDSEQSITIVDVISGCIILRVCAHARTLCTVINDNKIIVRRYIVPAASARGLVTRDNRMREKSASPPGAAATATVRPRSRSRFEINTAA